MKETGKKRRGKWVLLAVLGLLGAVGAGSIWYGCKEEAHVAAMAEVEAVSETQPVTYQGGYYTYNEEDMELLAAYQDYNPDVVGYIRIPDTVLNHPMMQSPEDEDFYLNHDLDGEVNSHGVPFLSAASKVERLGANMVVFGHNIHKKSRDVFCDLAYYEDLSYYKEHPIIETISESGTRKWLIFAYFITDNAQAGAFRYSDYTTFLANKDLQEYLGVVEVRNWLDVPVDVTYGDTLITLSSCSLELAGKGTNRMVVIGKLLENGEDYETYVEAAQMAENPLLPAELTVEE